MHLVFLAFLSLFIFLSSLCFQSGLDITKMIIYKKREDAKEKRRQKREERWAQRQAKREVMLF